MGGIYIHIPFCRTRCDYCAFYSTVSARGIREKYVDRLCREASERRAFFGGAPADSIYIGGGTPSQLSPCELQRIFSSLYSNFDIRDDAEVTVEVNPDDITEDYADALAALPVNRISMGVQSFSDVLLGRIHRRHTGGEAIEAYRILRQRFRNISLDLIYGLPGEDIGMWREDLKEMMLLCPEHISAYGLSYEEGTPLFSLLSEGKIKETGEEEYINMYSLLLDTLESHGYLHYEISNFCRGEEYRARHNSSYWNGAPYLGLGAGAHSYDGKRRRMNSPDVSAYIAAEEIPYEEEILSDNDRYDETVMTRLRTSDGLPLREVEKIFGAKRRDYLMERAASYISQGKIEIIGKEGDEMLRVSRSGLYVSDEIISDLMCPDEE